MLLSGLLASELLHNRDLESFFWEKERNLIYKKRNNETTVMSFQCRACKVRLSSPYELRVHSMVKHKGHMLPATES